MSYINQAQLEGYRYCRTPGFASPMEAKFRPYKFRFHHLTQKKPYIAANFPQIDGRLQKKLATNTAYIINPTIDGMTFFPFFYLQNFF